MTKVNKKRIMRGKDFADIVVALIVFAISASDFYRGILLAFTSKIPLLFTAQIGFGILKLLPASMQEHRNQKAMNAYIKRRKLNGLYGMVGGFLGMLLAILIFLAA
jgi:hypothetical protein